jgi:hypothetical protein
MPRRWISTGWMALCAAAIASSVTGGCGRSSGFEAPGQSNGIGAGVQGGSTGSNVGSSGQSTTAGMISGTAGGSSGNGTAGSTGFPRGSSGSGTGSPGTGTSAGFTSGGSTGGCGAQGALQRCRTDADCQCDSKCVPETGGLICEKTCVNTSDCPDLETTCVSGTCAPTFCGAHGSGPSNGDLDSTCNSVGTNDGSCIPQTFNDSDVGLCSQGGPSDGGCSPSATRQDLGAACVAGDVCLLLGESGNCFVMCDPDGRGQCGPTATCVVPLQSNPRLGVCEPSSSSTTGGTGATGGSTSGGTTGGGCNAAAPLIEFESCKTTADCPCPLFCNDDPLQSTTGSVCEYSCKTEACRNPLTICSDGGDICTTNGCGPGTGNGSFNSTCNVNGTNDGTCEPELLGDTSVGWCYLGGDATFDAGGCDPTAAADDLADLCPPGSLCYGASEEVGSCSELCDPNSGSGCPSGSFCAGIVDQPDLGVCIPGF